MNNLTLFILLVVFSFISCGKKANNIPEDNESAKLTKTSETVESDSVTFNCPGMHCSGCEFAIKSKVNKLDGIKEVDADAQAKIVKVIFDRNKSTVISIEKAINEAGYDTETSKSENKHECEKDKKKE